MIFLTSSLSSYSSIYTSEIEETLAYIIKSQKPEKAVKLSMGNLKWVDNKLNVSFNLELRENELIENYRVEGMMVDEGRNTQAKSPIFLGECTKLSQEMSFIKGAILDSESDDLTSYIEIELTLTILDERS